jgi:putative heme-binding domain-containing protein
MIGRTLGFVIANAALATIVLGAGAASAAGEEDPLRAEAAKRFGVIEPVPAEALASPAASLGRALFWDKRLSADGKTACASCHLPEDWGADRRRFSRDAKGKDTARNSQTVLNAVLQPSLRWTGYRKSGAHQAERSLAGSMGFASAEDVVSPPDVEDPATAEDAQPGPSGSWLKGSTEEKLLQIERHLRGLDLSMAEITYRYDELLAAGRARNWNRAKYQTEKIDLSLRLAIERRPKRAKSARPFLDETLPEVLRAIGTREGSALDAALERLRSGCIQCHRAENVLYLGRDFATFHPTPPAIADAIQEYRRKLTPQVLRQADRSSGRSVFSKHCGNCHRLFGEGRDGGPDLTPLQRPDLDYLLAATIDPNAVIGNDYQAVTVLATDGRTITGLVKREDQMALELQTAEDLVTVPQAEIRLRSPSTTSFMPEGLLQTLNDEQVRDLIGYLQGDEQAPLPPEKTE